jgi:DNA-binding transcriptional LysR family regulator
MNWEFKRRKRSVTAHVSGRLVFNGSNLIVEAALMGHGLIWVPDDIVAEHVSAGRLVRVLDDWAITYPGYHLYYASRRASPALGLLVEALRLKDDS